MDEQAKVSRRQVIATLGMTGAAALIAGATSAFTLKADIHTKLRHVSEWAPCR